jgi:aminopeptidase N
MLERVWSERSFTMASLIVRRLFPASVIDAELARRARVWLDAHTEPAPLHRLVAEQLSELERALAARERDAVAEREAAA